PGAGRDGARAGTSPHASPPGDGGAGGAGRVLDAIMTHAEDEPAIWKSIAGAAGVDHRLLPALARHADSRPRRPDAAGGRADGGRPGTRAGPGGRPRADGVPASGAHAADGRGVGAAGARDRVGATPSPSWRRTSFIPSARSEVG